LRASFFGAGYGAACSRTKPNLLAARFLPKPGVGLEPTTPSLPWTSSRGKADHSGACLAHIRPAMQPLPSSGWTPAVTACVRP